MNRPPGQGFPYDEESEKPPAPPEPPQVVPLVDARPRCGWPYPNNAGACQNTVPCPLHRDRLGFNIERSAAEAQDLLEERRRIFAEERERRGDAEGLNPIPKYDPDAPADLHDQLRRDEGPWSVRSRLAESLGRRALATRLADALPPLLGAELADRLDTLITQAITEHDAEVTAQLADHYATARARLDEETAHKLEELRRERFRPSRLD